MYEGLVHSESGSSFRLSYGSRASRHPAPVLLAPAVVDPLVPRRRKRRAGLLPAPAAAAAPPEDGLSAVLKGLADAEMKRDEEFRVEYREQRLREQERQLLLREERARAAVAAAASSSSAAAPSHSDPLPDPPAPRPLSPPSQPPEADPLFLRVEAMGRRAADDVVRLRDEVRSAAAEIRSCSADATMELSVLSPAAASDAGAEQRPPVVDAVLSALREQLEARRVDLTRVTEALRCEAEARRDDAAAHAAAAAEWQRERAASASRADAEVRSARASLSTAQQALAVAEQKLVAERRYRALADSEAGLWKARAASAVPLPRDTGEDAAAAAQLSKLKAELQTASHRAAATAERLQRQIDEKAAVATLAAAEAARVKAAAAEAEAGFLRRLEAAEQGRRGDAQRASEAEKRTLAEKALVDTLQARVAAVTASQQSEAEEARLVAAKAEQLSSRLAAAESKAEAAAAKAEEAQERCAAECASLRKQKEEVGAALEAAREELQASSSRCRDLSVMLQAARREAEHAAAEVSKQRADAGAEGRRLRTALDELAAAEKEVVRVRLSQEQSVSEAKTATRDWRIRAEALQRELSDTRERSARAAEQLSGDAEEARRTARQERAARADAEKQMLAAEAAAAKAGADRDTQIRALHAKLSAVADAERRSEAEARLRAKSERQRDAGVGEWRAAAERIEERFSASETEMKGRIGVERDERAGRAAVHALLSSALCAIATRASRSERRAVSDSGLLARERDRERAELRKAQDERVVLERDNRRLRDELDGTYVEAKAVQEGRVRAVQELEKELEAARMQLRRREDQISAMRKESLEDERVAKERRLELEREADELRSRASRLTAAEDEAADLRARVRTLRARMPPADAPIAAGSKVRVRDSAAEEWRTGEVTGMDGGEPLVRVQGSSRSFLWRQVEPDRPSEGASRAEAERLRAELADARAELAEQLATGEEVLVRDSVAEDWKKGVVSHVRGNTVLVTLVGQEQSFTWKILRRSSNAESLRKRVAEATSPIVVGGIARVRDAGESDWRVGTVTAITHARPLVRLPGHARGFMWDECEAATAAELTQHCLALQRDVDSAREQAAALEKDLVRARESNPRAPAVGDMVRVRDGEDWQTGRVTEVHGNRPVVGIAGRRASVTPSVGEWVFEKSGETWELERFIDDLKQQLAEARRGQHNVGDRVRVRDSEREQWKTGVVTGLDSAGKCLVKIDGAARSFAWGFVSPFTQADRSDPVHAVGDRVKVRDGEGDRWRLGVVTASGPDSIRVRADGCAQAFAWKHVGEAPAQGALAQLCVGAAARFRHTPDADWRIGRIVGADGADVVVASDDGPPMPRSIVQLCSSASENELTQRVEELEAALDLAARGMPPGTCVMVRAGEEWEQGVVVGADLGTGGALVATQRCPEPRVWDEVNSPVHTGGRVRVRDSVTEPWRLGTATGARDGKLLVMVDGTPRSFVWDFVEPVRLEQVAMAAAEAAAAAERSSADEAANASARELAAAKTEIARQREEEAALSEQLTAARAALAAAAADVDAANAAGMMQCGEVRSELSARIAAAEDSIRRSDDARGAAERRAAEAEAAAVAASLPRDPPAVGAPRVGDELLVRDHPSEDWQVGLVVAFAPTGAPLVLLPGQPAPYVWNEVMPHPRPFDSLSLLRHAGEVEAALRAAADVGHPVRLRVRDSESEAWVAGDAVSVRPVVSVDGSEPKCWNMAELDMAGDAQEQQPLPQEAQPPAGEPAQQPQRDGPAEAAPQPPPQQPADGPAEAAPQPPPQQPAADGPAEAAPQPPAADGPAPAPAADGPAAPAQQQEQRGPAGAAPQPPEQPQPGAPPAQQAAKPQQAAAPKEPAGPPPREAAAAALRPAGEAAGAEGPADAK